jgi:hypothetical protein
MAWKPLLSEDLAAVPESAQVTRSPIGLLERAVFFGCALSFRRRRRRM